MPQASRRLGSSVTRFSGRGSISPKETALNGPSPACRHLVDLHTEAPAWTGRRQIAGVEAGKVEAATLLREQALATASVLSLPLARKRGP